MRISKRASLIPAISPIAAANVDLPESVRPVGERNFGERMIPVYAAQGDHVGIHDGDEPTPDNVAAVVVTYGERFEYLHNVVVAILANGIEHIVIVDNASPEGNRTKIAALCASRSDRVSCHRLPENTGSAGGFATGMALAAKIPGMKFLWLFDDDNQPASDAFEKLCLAYKYLGRNPKVALVSFRSSRTAYFEAAVHGTDVGVIPGRFMNFSLADYIAGRFRKLYRKASRGNSTTHEFRAPILRIGVAPYGGLLLHSHWLDIVGLPEKKFFLYSDDHDYALRLLAQGGKIYLCTESRLKELEPSWPGIQSRIPIPMRRENDEWKIYCMVRNSTYLEQTLKQPKFIYAINKYSYFFVQICCAVLFGAGLRHTLRRARLMWTAAEAGRKGLFVADPSGLPILSCRPEKKNTNHD